MLPMAGGPKIKASSARAHTRRSGGRSSSRGTGGFGKVSDLLSLKEK